eukprot:6687693-Prymnesium_polylepis.1
MWRWQCARLVALAHAHDAPFHARHELLPAQLDCDSLVLLHRHFEQPTGLLVLLWQVPAVRFDHDRVADDCTLRLVALGLHERLDTPLRNVEQLEVDRAIVAAVSEWIVVDKVYRRRLLFLPRSRLLVLPSDEQRTEESRGAAELRHRSGKMSCGQR